ncbi:MAG: hypothetical protein JWM28_3454 [Chitinophagaceae bacterium]|nr:hypothetical protein [Chitinophagaceae bacterium]
MKNAANDTRAKTVDEYLQALPDDMRTMLEKLRLTIQSAAPKAEELISYQIPTYKYRGALVHFAAFKNHCSFIAASKNVIKIFSKELQDFKTSGTTIRFTPDQPLPAALVKKIVKTRIKENEERTAAVPVKKKDK